MHGILDAHEWVWQFIAMLAECEKTNRFCGMLRTFGNIQMRASIGFLVLLTTVWCILQESFSWQNVVLGLAVSIFTLTFTNLFVLKGDYSRRYAIRPLLLLWYLLVLVWKIYQSGFQAMAKILTGGVNVNVVDIQTDLENPFHIALLGNSITLTPGTVTMQTDGQNLKVIWIDAHTRDPEVAGKEIKGGFEALLKKAAARENTEKK